MKSFLFSQFGLPHGVLAHPIGWVMAIDNRQRNEWVVDQLPLRKDSRVLEIGFGPGVALAKLAKMVERGEIVGVDPSRAMLVQATRRNFRSIQEKRIRLVQGSVDDLPGDEKRFDVIFSVNTVGRHTELLEVIRRLHELLNPGGTVAIAEQPPYRLEDGALMEMRRGYLAAMTTAGYGDIQLFQKEMKPSPVVLVMGRSTGQSPQEAVYDGLRIAGMTVE